MKNGVANMQEEWIKIKMPDSDRNFYVANVIQDSDGVRITLNNEKTIVKICFDGQPALVRLCEENIRARIWEQAQEKYGNNFFVDCFFYRIEKSKLTKWVMEEGCGFYEKSDFTHYCICTSTNLIDIVADFEPIIKTYPVSKSQENSD